MEMNSCDCCYQYKLVNDSQNVKMYRGYIDSVFAR